HLHVIDPHPRLVVDRTEVQQHASALRDMRRQAGNLEFAPVPASTVEVLIANAAHRAFGRVRHLDGQGPVRYIAWRAPAQVMIEGEVPRAVETGPLGAAQLGSRISVECHASMRLEGQWRCTCSRSGAAGCRRSPIRLRQRYRSMLRSRI